MEKKKDDYFSNIPDFFGKDLNESFFADDGNTLVKCKFQLRNGRFLNLDDFDTTSFMHRDKNNEAIFYTFKQVKKALEIYLDFYKKMNIQFPELRFVYYNEDESEAVKTEFLSNLNN